MGTDTMRMFHFAAALAAFLVAGPVLAQQTAIHSVPIGKGAGNTGFNAAVPGTAGQPLVSNGPSADPGFGTIANSGFTAGAANTAKGSLNGTTVVDLPLPSCTAVNQAWKYVPGTGINCGIVSTTGGYDMPINLGLSALASGNALTLTLTQASGAAPNSANPVLVPFRSTVATTGTVTFTPIVATLSLTIPSGATLGTSNGVPFRVWIFLEYNAGIPELAAATCSNVSTVFPCATWEHTLPTTTTIGGSSNTGGTLYATTGVAADAVRIVGFCSFGSGLTTAGTWASSCTSLQVFGPGVAKPGDVVQSAYNTNSSALTSQAITPTSAVNQVEFIASANCVYPGATATAVQFAFQRTITPTTITLQTYSIGGGGASSIAELAAVAIDIVDSPGVVSPVTYSIGGNGGCSGAIKSAITLKEIQG